ncbi:hypothetical protein [Tepidibacillus marianensis]|uniref:hypothetical protein n=1 Tax=Tepidibacillus marianensis TaxID=3131995 RepID=UPI0030D35224
MYPHNLYPKHKQNIQLDSSPQLVNKTTYVSPETIIQIVGNQSTWESKTLSMNLHTDPLYPYIQQVITNLDQYVAILPFLLFGL